MCHYGTLIEPIQCAVPNKVTDVKMHSFLSSHYEYICYPRQQKCVNTEKRRFSITDAFKISIFSDILFYVTRFYSGKTAQLMI